MPIPSLDDVIVAVATPQPGGVRGIVRLAGEGVARVLDPFLDSPLLDRPHAYRHAAAFRLPEPFGLVPVDVYYWPNERSYAGQPMAELHTVGCVPILEAMHAACCRCGARPAERGEFTRRAFLAGKLDLTQAEAVWEVIHADHEDALQGALRRLAGGLALPLQALRGRLLSMLAELEAGLDFAEEDIEFIAIDDLARACGDAERTVARLLEQLDDRSTAGVVPRVVFVGRANAGKSSLVNALAGRTVAIVSSAAGTTRDPVTATVSWHGRQLELCDTAGDQDVAAGSLQAAALGMGDEALRAADVVVRCIAVTEQLPPGDRDAPGGKNELLVWTKCDLGEPRDTESGVVTSAVRGTGLEMLREAIVRQVDASSSTSAAGTASARCRAHLEGAREALARVASWDEPAGCEELVAAELRAALDHIGELVGVVYTDDLLDEIFGRFCIGK